MFEDNLLQKNLKVEFIGTLLNSVLSTRNIKNAKILILCDWVPQCLYRLPFIFTERLLLYRYSKFFYINRNDFFIFDTDFSYGTFSFSHAEIPRIPPSGGMTDTN